jgi:hypothetical protein
MIYFDDLLVLADEAECLHLESVFQKESQWITMIIGSKQSYLGMQIIMNNDSMIIDMTYFVNKLLSDKNILNPTPAKKECFLINQESKLLPYLQKKQFHTDTTKLLYLPKCAYWIS